MVKIVFFEAKDWEVDYLKQKLGRQYSLQFVKQPLNEKTAEKARDADGIGIFVYSKVNENVLKKLPKLKIICTMSTGYDHITLLDCDKKQVKIANVPTYGDNTVAEHAFALLLALSRKIVESVDRVKRNDFSLENLTGFDLKNKTIGVIGTGNIGRNSARIARGFQMNVIAFDVFPNMQAAAEIGFQYVSFDELLKQSDIITIHCPYNEKTHHLIDKKAVAKMKKGIVLINTARGGIVDTSALLDGLKSKKISAAGLDVLEDECTITEEKELIHNTEKMKLCDLKTALQQHMLISQDNVIVTPHNAFNSKEALQRILDVTCQNFNFYFDSDEKTNPFFVKLSQK